MNRTRSALALAAGLLATAALGACSSADGGSASTGRPGSVELRYQGWANEVTLPELAEDLGYFDGKVALKWVGNTISGPQDIQSAATGQTDFGGAFAGAVVKLIQAGAPVTPVIDYYGADAKNFTGYYVKQDSPIRTARDLVGKKIAVNTLGAHHEAVIATWLAKNGLSDAEIKQVQLVVVPPNDTESALRKDRVDVGTLGGVLQDHAVAVGGVRPLFTDVSLFGPFNGGQYVLRDEFIKKQPEASRAFVTGVAKAIEWERTTPKAEVIARFTKIINERERNESTANLKYWKSVGVPSRGGVISDQDFVRWAPWLHKAGIIPAVALDLKGFYTNEFNPYAAAAPAKSG